MTARPAAPAAGATPAPDPTAERPPHGPTGGSLPPPGPPGWSLPLLTLLAALTVLLGCLVGSVPLPLAAVGRTLAGWLGLGGFAPDPTAAVLLSLRVPRVLAGFATGGLLAVAGALMQVLLGNPLADPYVLGISGGAAVGALLALGAGLGVVAVKGGALAGAVLALLLVLVPLLRPGRGVTTPGGTLLLTGVVLAAGWSALVTLILTFAPDAQLRGMLFWLMGDLDGVQAWQPAAFGLLLLVTVTRMLAADLNMLLHGTVAAFALGVPVARRQWQVHLLAAAATALAVTTAGTIGFVGLIVPHAARRLFGNDQRTFLPACALLGGTLLCLADTGARVLLRPVQLPVGVVMALLGVPAFLWVLQGGRR